MDGCLGIGEKFIKLEEKLEKSYQMYLEASAQLHRCMEGNASYVLIYCIEQHLTNILEKQDIIRDKIKYLHMKLNILYPEIHVMK